MKKTEFIFRKDLNQKMYGKMERKKVSNLQFQIQIRSSNTLRFS